MHRPFQMIFKVTTFEKGVAIKEFTEISSITTNQKAMMTGDGSLKRLHLHELKKLL
jgi:hypothetical protein